MNKILIIWFMVLPLGLAAQEYTQLLELAQQAYEQKDFQQAQSNYQQILGNYNRRNSGIYHNLGNCYYQMEDYPRALWAYLSASSVSPMKGELRINLQKVRTALRNPYGIPDELFSAKLLFWYPLLSQSLWKLGALLFFSALWIFLILKRIKGWDVSWPLYLFMGLFLFFLLPQLVYVQNENKPRAVLIQEGTLHSGNASFYEVLLDGQTITAGTEMRILEIRGNWCRVKLGNGQEGWLPMISLYTIGGDGA